MGTQNITFATRSGTPHSSADVPIKSVKRFMFILRDVRFDVLTYLLISDLSIAWIDVQQVV